VVEAANSMTDNATRNHPDKSNGSKPVVVLSGVSLRESGTLVLYREALSSLERLYGDHVEIVAMVKSRDLFDTPGVTYMEFPHIMHSWLARLWFEYWTSKGISRRLRPRLWLSLHETSPNVDAEIRAVYCHNVSEFYRITPSEFLLDWRFGMFTLFFRLIHRINIRKNQFVIVQADWIRKIFETRYGISHVVVAPPELNLSDIPRRATGSRQAGPYRFFYPFVPRPYKNVELCLQAARVLEQEGVEGFELWLTMDEHTNKYASRVAKEFSDLRCVRWLGVIPREKVFDLYGEADCLVFPSRLEASALPISEFRGLGKTMLLADLPYAWECARGNTRTCFFDPADAGDLAALMNQAIEGELVFRKVPEIEFAEPFAQNWEELWGIVLGREKTAGANQ
jgi:glycosyltransferase involved in cell wall biosynthesis